ncbi:MAG: protoglobin domain-containing protein [Deferrisomatales bacterium]|nr:protoglobin domain-containing protein [Deferrisomatales bacterium]
MKEVLRDYRFGPVDEKNLPRLAELLLPAADSLADEFYDYLAEDPQTARYFETPEAVERRKTTIKGWFRDLLAAEYDNRLLRRLERIGKVHVKIGLPGHFVNAAMHFIRSFCSRHVAAQVPDPRERDALVATLDKALDLHLDVLTSSYREEELKNVFLSRRFESVLVRWAERLLHGLNLLLMVGLLAMAVGVLSLFVSDIVHAFGTDLARGVIQSLGSLLLLWMMIELLQAEVDHLRGGKFHVRLFLELALVAFIRKLFIAALDHPEPVIFALLLASLLVLGVIFFLMVRAEPRARG